MYLLFWILQVLLKWGQVQCSFKTYKFQVNKCKVNLETIWNMSEKAEVYNWRSRSFFDLQIMIQTGSTWLPTGLKLFDRKCLYLGAKLPGITKTLKRRANLIKLITIFTKSVNIIRDFVIASSRACKKHWPQLSY